MESAKTIGETKDAGFQIGVRKTFPVSVDTAWEFLFSARGLSIWLGDLQSGNFKINQPYETKHGIEGEIKVFKVPSHIRLSWKKKQWTNSSTLQVRVIKATCNATISFHQEKLLDSKQRDEMKKYWDNIIVSLLKKFTEEN